MELYEKIRNRQDDVINQNPANIVITRTSRTEGTDGGWVDSASTLDSQKARVYSKLQLVTIVTEAGYSHIRANKMVMKYDADVEKKTADNVDIFTYMGKTYQVIDVKPITTQGYVVFKECFIEEID